MDSILASTKKLAGITDEYEYFDSDVIMYINSVFLVLKQIGVGPSEGFVISDDSSIWSDFIPDNIVIREAVKSYMGDKVRYKFDPPTTASVMEALCRRIDEAEWRLREEAELSNIPGEEGNQDE